MTIRRDNSADPIQQLQAERAADVARMAADPEMNALQAVS